MSPVSSSYRRASRKCEAIFDVDERARQLEALEELAAAADFWNDQNRAKGIIAETNQLRAVLNPFESVRQAVEDVEVLISLVGDDSSEEDRASAEVEVEETLGRAEAEFEKLEFHMLLAEKFDGRNAYVTLHAGAGGTESCDWADMLFRMYRRYCETQGFDCEVIDYQPGDEAGIKSVTFSVVGPYAYGYMKAERGVHRLVRISPFDTNKRRHTSFAALDVVAEVDDDVEIEIKDEDLRIDTFRSSGAGGQHVNTTDSAVRITHMPSGIVVSCQAERSQHKNRAKAFKLLKARLYEWTQDQKRKDMEKFYGEKGEIAWGSQIRSYVLQPYTMVKDHRTSEETSNVQAVLDGNIHDFVVAYLKQDAKTRGRD